MILKSVLRNGDGIVFHRERIKQTVANERSPPLRVRMSSDRWRFAAGT